MVADRPHQQAKAEVSRNTEVREVDNREHLMTAHLQQHGGDVGQLRGKDLIAASQQWQKEFQQLPLKADGHIDTKQLTEGQWKTIDHMYKELNKPGGAIATAQGAVDKISTELRGAHTQVAQTETHPGRSRA